MSRCNQAIGVCLKSRGRGKDGRERSGYIGKKQVPGKTGPWMAPREKGRGQRGRSVGGIGTYLKTGSLPKRTTKVINEMPETATAIVAALPILVGLWGPLPAGQLQTKLEEEGVSEADIHSTVGMCKSPWGERRVVPTNSVLCSSSCVVLMLIWCPLHAVVFCSFLFLFWHKLPARLTPVESAYPKATASGAPGGKATERRQTAVGRQIGAEQRLDLLVVPGVPASAQPVRRSPRHVTRSGRILTGEGVPTPPR